MAKQPKEILVLSGVTNAGKTTTLKKVIKALASSGYKRLDLDGDDIAKTKGDIRAAFEVNRTRVGICTAGDTAKVIKDTVKWAVELEIDILVTASKSTGKADSVKTIVTTSIEWNVYPVFLTLMTYPHDKRRNHHEAETAKQIIDVIRQKSIRL